MCGIRNDNEAAANDINRSFLKRSDMPFFAVPPIKAMKLSACSPGLNRRITARFLPPAFIYEPIYTSRSLKESQKTSYYSPTIFYMIKLSDY
jgi:hypothetical protein